MQIVGANHGEKIGLFYVSYEDALIESDLYGITEVEEVDYDHIYQYDMLGDTGNYSYSNIFYAANVFQKETNGIEKLNAITVNLKTKYSICEVYVNQYDDDKNLSSFVKVGTIKNEDKVGYTTLKLDNPIKIYGNTWTVMVKVTSEKGGDVSIGIEKAFNNEQRTAVANKGESFISSQPGNNMEDVSETEDANIGIKARTVELVSNEFINFNAPSQILKAGQVLTIKIGMSEEIEGTAPTLKIKCGNGATKSANFVAIRDGKTLEYNYTIEQEDNGSINLIGLTGGNLNSKSGKEIAYDLINIPENRKGIADNLPPNASIEYTEQDGTVIATITFDEENVTILNNEGKPNYTFVRNGSFTFKFEDELGNIGEKTATVDKLTAFTEKDIQNSYDIITGTDRKYMKINHFKELQYDGKYTLSIKEMVNEIITQVKNETTDDGNGNTSSSSSSVTINSSSSNVYIYSSTNSTVEADDTVKTGMKLKVGDNEYTMICIGDLNGDGKITATDLSRMKLSLVGIEELSEDARYAADVNNDGKMSVTDLSNIKFKIVGLM